MINDERRLAVVGHNSAFIILKSRTCPANRKPSFLIGVTLSRVVAADT